MNLKFGLIGKKLSHSFSQRYFAEKFKQLNLNHYSYELWELEDIKNIRSFIDQQGNVRGFNVTIPYKKEIISHLDSITDEVKQIGACNCVLIENNQWIGYNTDWWGFYEMIKDELEPPHTSAMILGTGGAANAVAYAFQQFKMPYVFVSRNKFHSQCITYDDLNKMHFEKYPVIVNTTPLGMYPDTASMPAIPIHYLSNKNFVIDLIYNPEKTLLLQESEKHKAKILNGLKMLYLQAEKSWYIWQKI